MKMIMLVGCSGSGKSTLAAQLLGHDPDLVIISPDTVLEEIAEAEAISYQDAYDRYAAQANDICLQTAEEAFSRKLNVVWDQTNLTRHLRATRLELVPDGYERIAACFTGDVSEIRNRISSRVREGGRNVPDKVVYAQIRALEIPHYDEGFDQIVSQIVVPAPAPELEQDGFEMAP